MNKSSSYILLVQKKRINRAAIIVLVCVLFGVFYPIMNGEFTNPLAFFNGSVIGILGGLAIAIHEDHSFYRNFKREHFLVRLFKNVTLYTLFFALVIAIIVGITYGFESGEGIFQYITGPEFQEFIFHGDYYVILLYTLFFCGAVTFTLGMSAKVESRVLYNIISSKYRIPREEERIFMSIDLNNSTEIAEKLGEEQFFKFLNKFYLDLTPAIISTNAEIYRYVGDQVTLSWPVRSRDQNNDCLRTYFMAKNQLSNKAEEYYKRWGFEPKFKAVFHVGTIVAGEIGQIKRQFVFHGKALHTLALIEKQCKPLEVNLLLSSIFTKVIQLPGFYKLMPCRSDNIEEGDNNITLYTVVPQLNSG